jgi:DNA-binding NtrC family response regulator
VYGTISGICGIARDITERRERERALQDHGPESPVDDYSSPVMRATLDQMRLAAGTDIIVLLSGESGAGKDYFANYLHEQSPRAGGPFFTINCAAVPAELAESELFGHEAGAFTGSAGRKRGLLELAEGGTLLLNEIGDLSLQVQAKLLTFLDTHSFTRVGGEKPISVQARLIAATNRNLQDEIAAGNFRQDLFYRLSVIEIRIPPLRERKGDIPVLVRTIIKSLGKKLPFRNPTFVDAAAMEMLESYDWPGNVRELRNVLERAMIHSDGDRIGPPEIVLDTERSAGLARGPELSYTLRIGEDSSLTEEFKAAKRFLVAEGLRRSEGSVKKAADLLGVSRDAFNYLIRSLGIRKPQ